MRHRINDISDQIQEPTKVPRKDLLIAPSHTEKSPFPNCFSMNRSILPSTPAPIPPNVMYHNPSPKIEKTINSPKIGPTTVSSPSPDIKNTAISSLIPSSSDALSSFATTFPKASFPSYIEGAKSKSKSPKSQKTATGLSPQG